jgi:hypothetical protein
MVHTAASLAIFALRTSRADGGTEERGPSPRDGVWIKKRRGLGGQQCEAVENRQVTFSVDTLTRDLAAIYGRPRGARLRDRLSYDQRG